MASTLHDLGIDRFTFEDRLALLQEIWESIAVEAENSPLTDEQCREVDRRLAAYQADPRSAIPWEQVEAEVESRLKR